MKKLKAVLIIVACILPAAPRVHGSVIDSIGALLGFAPRRDSPEALKAVARAEQSLQEGLLFEAIAGYRDALGGNLTPKKRAAVLNSLGETYLYTRQYASAIEVFQEATVLFPRAEEGHIALARAYEQSELHELARLEYLDVIKAHPRSCRAHLFLGRLYLSEGKTSQAMDSFRVALTLHPGADLYRAIAACARETGDDDLALAMLNEVISSDHTYDDYLQLGTILGGQGRSAEAENAFTNAIRIDPDKEEGYVELARLYLETGDCDKAEKILLIVKERSPREALVHFFLAQVYARQGKTRAAAEEFRLSEQYAHTSLLKDFSRKFALSLHGR